MFMHYSLNRNRFVLPKNISFVFLDLYTNLRASASHRMSLVLKAKTHRIQYMVILETFSQRIPLEGKT